MTKSPEPSDLANTVLPERQALAAKFSRGSSTQRNGAWTDPPEARRADAGGSPTIDRGSGNPKSGRLGWPPTFKAASGLPYEENST